jgi:hypothetical protein
MTITQNEKIFICPKEFYIDSLKLAKQVYESDFTPNFIVGLWRGGTPVGIAVQEYLSYKGIETDHIAIRTSKYNNKKTDVKTKKVAVHGLDYIIRRANATDRLLLVDDVFDEGHTIKVVIEEIKKRARLNCPQIKSACVYFKPQRNDTDITPDFYVHETNQWLVFPHELHDLTPEEIRKHKGYEVADLLEI